MCKINSKLNALNVINLILVLFIFAGVKNYAQDIHFSQFKSTPLFINPANTGISTSDIRFSNDYRSQWQQIDKPYNTLMLAFDARMNVYNRRIGIGAMVVHDQSSGDYLNSDKFFLSFSHTFFYRNQQIVIGLQPGYVLKKISNNSITFGNQFDPNGQVFDPSIPSNEVDLNDDLSYFDLNVGVLWQTRIKTILPAFGVSIDHINRPIESFYTDNSEKPLPLKYTAHGNISIPVTKKYLIEPQALFSYTKGSKEFIGGASLYYYPGIQNLKLERLYGISALRINPVRNFDALILGVGIDIAGFDICFTYDINVSSLREVSRYQGAYEISVLYNISRKQNTHKAEPCFML